MCVCSLYFVGASGGHRFVVVIVVVGSHAILFLSVGGIRSVASSLLVCIYWNFRKNLTCCLVFGYRSVAPSV